MKAYRESDTFYRLWNKHLDNWQVDKSSRNSMLTPDSGKFPYQKSHHCLQRSSPHLEDSVSTDYHLAVLAMTTLLSV
jgi:hypothetical protein